MSRLAAASKDALERGHHLSCSAGGRDESVAQALDLRRRRRRVSATMRERRAFLVRAAELSLDPEGERTRMREVEAAAGPVPPGRRPEGRGGSRPASRRAAPVRGRAGEGEGDAHQLPGRRRMSYEENVAELQLALIDAAGDDATAAALHVELAEATAGMFRLEQSLQHSRAAVGLADQAGQTTIQATALGLIGLVESLLGCGVTDAARRAYAMWDETTFSGASYSPRMSLAEACLYAADFTEAERLYLEELAMAEERGLEVIEVICTCASGGDATARRRLGRGACERAPGARARPPGG